MVPWASTLNGSRTRPLSRNAIWGSSKFGFGSGASTIWTTTFSPFLFFIWVLAQPHPFPFPGGDTGVFFIFIIPQTTSIKTTVCTRSPVVVGHPVGDAIICPKIRRTNLNVSGLAMMKKSIPETIEIINFSSCFLPLHPHQQSLNRHMVCLVCNDKKISD